MSRATQELTALARSALDLYALRIVHITEMDLRENFACRGLTRTGIYWRPQDPHSGNVIASHVGWGDYVESGGYFFLGRDLEEAKATLLDTADEIRATLDKLGVPHKAEPKVSAPLLHERSQHNRRRS